MFLPFVLINSFRHIRTDESRSYCIDCYFLLGNFLCQSIKAHAEARGESVNGFVNRAISEAMERDNGAPAASEGLEKEKPQA